MADVPMETPWWAEILDLASEWAKAPWEIVYDKGPTLWVVRQRVWSRTLANARKEKQKHDAK